MGREKTYFKKGQSGNPDGKPKGAITRPHFRKFIADLLDDNREQIIQDFKRLKARDRVKYFIDLSQYVVPRMQAVNVSHDFKEMLTGVSDDEILRMMDEMISRRHLANKQSNTTIDLTANDYQIGDNSQPEGQRIEEE